VSDSGAVIQDGREKVVGDGGVAQAGRGLRKKKSFIHSLFVKTQQGDM
jgi:hypothetical protein